MKTLLLFIHGLGGDSRKTWGAFPRLIKQDQKLDSAVDFRFYSFPTPLFRLPFFSPAPNIQTLAGGLATELEHRYRDYKRVILVAHSLGGLVARKYLVDMAMQERSHKVAGLLLYAVPHDGAGLASVAQYLSWRHPQLEQLCKESDLLENLNTSWQQLKLKDSIPCKYIIAGTDAVVSKSSAQGYWGNDSVETVVDKGHIDVVKPDDSNDLAFQILKNFICDGLPDNVAQMSEIPPQQTTEVLDITTTIPNNLPYPNQYFSGRIDQLSQLHQSLQAKNPVAITQPVAVHGLGGVGKIQLAIQYAWQYRSHYSALFWIEADTDLAWKSGLERLAEIMQIAPVQSEIRLQAVRDWLHQNNNWLLIVDNIDSDNLQQHLVKESEQFHGGYWLFTSRLSQWSPQVTHIDLDHFNEEEAVKFLHKRLQPPINEKDAADLSEQLGFLPLALEQASAYILMQGISIKNFLTLLNTQPVTVLQAAPKNYPRAVWETWSLSRHVLDEDAQALMQLLCSFAAEPLSREVIMDQTDIIAKTLWNKQTNGFQRVEKALTSY